MNYTLEIIETCIDHVSKKILNKGEYKKQLGDYDLDYEKFGVLVYIDDSLSEILTEEDFFSEILGNRQNIIDSALCYPSYMANGDMGIKLMQDNDIHSHFIDIPIELDIETRGFFSKKYQVRELSCSLSMLKFSKADFSLLSIDNEHLELEIERAKNGDSGSQFLVGLYYFLGLNGIEKNTEEGFYWLKVAAESSNIHAICMVGSLYCSESIEHKNIKEGLELLNESAENGHLYSQLMLGNLYFEGRLVEIDYCKSEYFYLKASKQNSKLASHQLGNMFYEGILGNKNFKKAYEFYFKSANLGMPESQFNMSLMYAKGEYVDQNFKAAETWMIKASSLGMPEADYNLFKLYCRDHEGVPKNDREALHWLRNAADKGHAEAKEKLSKLGEKI